MNLIVLFAYLIIAGKSTKRDLAEFIGGRGVGFFSVFNGAKEINLKTSTGDGTTYYFKFEPIYDAEQKICDITTTAYQKQENFKGTIIDRVSTEENAELEAARSLSAIRQYGSFIDANKVKILANQVQINKDLDYLGELQFAKIGACKIYSNAECAFTAGGIFVKNIDEFYWETIPPFIAAALKHNGILIDLPSKIALVRERNNFQNADKFIEHFKPLFFQLCLNAYCMLLKNGKISDDYFPYDLFDCLQPGRSFFKVETIMKDINALNKGQLVTDYKKYLNHDLCIKLLSYINFIPYGANKVSIATIAELNKNGYLEHYGLPEFIANRLRRYESAIENHHSFNEQISNTKNEYEKELERYKYCSWLPMGAFEGTPNWELFYSLIQDIIASVSKDYGLMIDLHFSTIEPGALAYVNPRSFKMVTKDNAIYKQGIVYFNQFSWWNDLERAFSGEDFNNLIMELIKVISHEIAHIIEGSGCTSGTREFTHDHFFKETHAQVFSKILTKLDIKQLEKTADKRSRAINKSTKETIEKHLPNAKELMIIQLLGKKDYLEFLVNEEKKVQPGSPMEVEHYERNSF